MRGGPLQSEAAVKLRFKGIWLSPPLPGRYVFLQFFDISHSRMRVRIGRIAEELNSSLIGLPLPHARNIEETI